MVVAQGIQQASLVVNVDDDEDVAGILSENADCAIATAYFNPRETGEART